ncbi:MAG: bifunctional folylpolyglutamate synthase/dihydrofolate synthase [Phycisphaerales bacterium]|nr:bifunctional folylpolyglutamate synthase/dihydrofolate synthase [Phycisphaerales bacterium]
MPRTTATKAKTTTRSRTKSDKARTAPTRRSSNGVSKTNGVGKSNGTGKTDANGLRTYRSALNYLKSITNFERTPPTRAAHHVFKLNRIDKLLSKLGRPERKMKCVHIAGTKGKGSTAAMVACMLRKCGYKVGLYTSPHLISVRERMTINGERISERDFTKTMAHVVGTVNKLPVRERQPTYFEIVTATAFTWFAENEVEVAVIETGLGGRLDSTNVIRPEACAITSISYDHPQILGDTLAKIAEEKAGIIKEGIPVVCAPQEPEVMKVLKSAAERVNAPLCLPGKDNEFSYRFESSRPVGPHTRLSLTTSRSRFEHLHVPLPGEHQAINCSVALSVMDALKSRGFEIDDQKAIEGLADVKLEGRMEIISDEPRILIDGAHNAASVEALMRAIGQTIRYDSMVVIFACQRDKDISGMLRHVQLGADKIIFTSSRTSRSADPHELLTMFQERCSKMAQVADTLEEAMEIATSAVTREDLICITGSFYIVGEAARKLRKNKLTV